MSATVLSAHIFNSIRGVSSVENAYPTFVETDATTTETAYNMTSFKNIVTIFNTLEKKQEAEQEYQGNKIKFFNGSPSTTLSSLISNKTITGNAVFFVNTVMGGESRQCSIKDSITVINSSFEQNCIIMVNDLGSLHGCHDDDGELEKDIKNILSKRCEATYKIESSESDSYKVIFHLKKIVEEEIGNQENNTTY